MGRKFFQFAKYSQTYRAGLQETTKLFEPLRGTAFTTVWLIYARGASAWEEAGELLSSSGLPTDEIVQSIDRFSASDELFSHIFFEKYLELCFPNHSPQDFMEMGRDMAEGRLEKPTGNVDWTQLYHYCEQLFAGNDLDHLLTTAYMFRMPVLQRSDAVLLTNERLIPFLASFPVELEEGPNAKSVEQSFDTAAWEFFRQLVSPVLDPLNEDCVLKLSELIKSRNKEINALKSKCLGLAHELGEESDVLVMQRRIASHIRGNVEKEVQDVLDLDKRAVNDLLDLVFADEKTWIGIAVFLYSLINGGDILTAGSAVYALSNLGSKAFKTAREERKKLKTSDYALLYRLK